MEVRRLGESGRPRRVSVNASTVDPIEIGPPMGPGRAASHGRERNSQNRRPAVSVRARRAPKSPGTARTNRRASTAGRDPAIRRVQSRPPRGDSPRTRSRDRAAPRARGKTSKTSSVQRGEWLRCREATTPSSRPSKRTRSESSRSPTRTAVASRGRSPVRASRQSDGWQADQPRGRVDERDLEVGKLEKFRKFKAQGSIISDLIQHLVDRSPKFEVRSPKTDRALSPRPRHFLRLHCLTRLKPR